MSDQHSINHGEQQMDVQKSTKTAQSPENTSMETLTRMQQNMVTTVDLLGTPIIALLIDGQERLCLAQISNTLLKQYSYNEVHNRRVALGINCVQCTPVQLEILRRTGAMPVSSRRCGMITKKEAERLCKSFLIECPPPQLPDGFFFSVAHKCAWGCKGSFIPSRYNSSRAKCIQCSHCRLFFSPNKFIFHSHRFPESTYTQPDAANFNNWRRHLHLTAGVKEKIADRRSFIPHGQASEEMVNLWEDVKAMFNGGTRRRFTSSDVITHPGVMTSAKQDSVAASSQLIRNFCNFKPDLPTNKEVIKQESQSQICHGIASSFIESAFQAHSTTLDLPRGMSRISTISGDSTMSMQYSWLWDRYVNNYSTPMRASTFSNSNVINGHLLAGLPFWASNPFLSRSILAQNQTYPTSSQTCKDDHSKLTPEAMSQESSITHSSNHNNIFNDQYHNIVSSNRYDIRSLLMTSRESNSENLIEQLRQAAKKFVPEQDYQERDNS